MVLQTRKEKRQQFCCLVKLDEEIQEKILDFGEKSRVSAMSAAQANDQENIDTYAAPWDQRHPEMTSLHHRLNIPKHTKNNKDD